MHESLHESHASRKRPHERAQVLCDGDPFALVVVKTRAAKLPLKGKLDRGLCRGLEAASGTSLKSRDDFFESFSPRERACVQTVAVGCPVADPCPGFRLRGDLGICTPNRSAYRRGGRSRNAGGKLPERAARARSGNRQWSKYRAIDSCRRGGRRFGGCRRWTLDWTTLPFAAAQ